MPYFESKSASGSDVITIDDTYQNLTLVHKGSGNAVEQYGDYGAAIGTTTWTGQSSSVPILAVRSPYGCGMFSSKKSGNTHTFRTVFSHATNYDYYIFDSVRNYTSATSGLVIRDANGGVVFDAFREYMKVAGLLGIGGSTGISMPSGRKYAVASGMANSRFDVTVNPTTNHYSVAQHFPFAFVNESNGSATVNNALIYIRNQQGSATPGSFGDALSSSLVLDVNHY